MGYKEIKNFLLSRGIDTRTFTDIDSARKRLEQVALDYYGVTNLAEAFTKFKRSRGYISAIPKLASVFVMENLLAVSFTDISRRLGVDIVGGEIYVRDREGRIRKISLGEVG
jgi:hypothetical protein